MHSLKAPQLTMMEQCTMRLVSEGEVFLLPSPPTPRKDQLLSEKDPQKQPEAARTSSTLRMFVIYSATRGEAQSGAH